MINYQYDSQNRLVSVGDTSYTYDAANNRIGKNENGVITRYVVNPNAALSQLLMETDVNGTAQAYYIYGIGLVGKIDVNGNKYYSYHFDNRGNTVALTDETGEVTDRYNYEPYGEIIQKIDETENCFLYVGQYGVMAENNGLYYMRARYYNPEIKAFINEDTVIGNVADTLSLNRYAYGSNNPLRYIDPTGHVSAEIASQIIKDNSQYIIDSAARYGVDPAIVAGCIYVEQVTNVDWIDTAGDRFYFLDTSIGVGQVKISTARLVEDMGYIGVTRSYKNYGNRIVVSREEAIYEKLMDNETNINYVAAYLSYWQDVWTEVFPQISKRADILGTLYNLGERANPPNPTPKANPFGINVGLAYGYMKHLLEIK